MKKHPHIRIADETDEKSFTGDRDVLVSAGSLYAFVCRYADSTYNSSQCRGDTSDPHRYPNCPAADRCLQRDGPIWEYEPRKCAVFIWKALTGETIEE